jgi:hypothetical protein
VEVELAGICAELYFRLDAKLCVSTGCSVCEVSNDELWRLKIDLFVTNPEFGDTAYIVWTNHYKYRNFVILGQVTTNLEIL